MTGTTPLFLSAFLLQNATRPSISYYEDAAATNARRLTTTAVATASYAARRASVTYLADAPPPPSPDVLVEQPSTAIYLYGFCLILIPTATILGNLLVIVSVLRFKILHSAINFLILGLAVADLLVAIFVMPYAVYVYIQGGYWFLGELMCDIYSASDVACSTASILLLAVISFDRYRAVSQPIKYSRQSRNIKRVVCILLSIWFFSFALASPIVLGVNNRPQDANPYECRFYNPIFSIVSSVGSFVVPCFVILFVYIRIMIALRKREKAARLRRLANQQAERAHGKAFESGDEVGELVAGPAVNMMMMALPSMTRRMRRFERHKQAIDHAGDRRLPWANHKPINGGGASAGARGGIGSPRELLLSRQFSNSISAAVAAATTTMVGGGTSARPSPLPIRRKTSIAYAARCRLGNFYGRHRRERWRSDSEDDDFYDDEDDEDDEDIFDIDEDEDDEDEDEDDDEEEENVDQWTFGRLGRRFEAPQLHRVWMINKEKAALAQQSTTPRHNSLCAALLSGDNSEKLSGANSKFSAIPSLKKNSVEAEDAADVLLQQRHQMALRRRFTKRQRRRQIRAAVANAASTLSASDANTNSRAASKRPSATTFHLMGAFSMIAGATARTSIVSFREASSTASASSTDHNVAEQQAALVSTKFEAGELNNKMDRQIKKRSIDVQRPQQLLPDVILSPLRLNGALFSPIMEQVTPLESKSLIHFQDSSADMKDAQEEYTVPYQPVIENSNLLGQCKSKSNVKANECPESLAISTDERRMAGSTSVDNLQSLNAENFSRGSSDFSSSSSSIHGHRQVLDTLTIQNIYSLSCPSIAASASADFDEPWLLLASLVAPPPTRLLPRRPPNVVNSSPPSFPLCDEKKPLKNASSTSYSYCFGDFPSIPPLPHPTNIIHPGLRSFPNYCCVERRGSERVFSMLMTSSEPEISASPRYTIGIIPPPNGVNGVRRRMSNNNNDDTASPENNANVLQNSYEWDSICYIDELEESNMSPDGIVVGTRPTLGLTQTEECCYSSPSTTASISSNYPYTKYERDLVLSSTPCSSQDSLSDNFNVVTNDFVSEAQTTTSRKESSDEHRLYHKCGASSTLLRHSASATGIAGTAATVIPNHRHRQQYGRANSSSCACGGAVGQFNDGAQRQTDGGVCAHCGGEFGDREGTNMNDSGDADGIRRKRKTINHFSRFKKSLRLRARALALNAPNRRPSAPPTSPLVPPEHIIPAIFRRFSRRGPLFFCASIISSDASTKPRLRCGHDDDGPATQESGGEPGLLRHEAAFLSRRRSESQAATMIVARPPLDRYHHHYHHYAGHHVVPIGAGGTAAALSAMSRRKSCRAGFQKWRVFSADLSDYVPPPSPCEDRANDTDGYCSNHHYTTMSNAHNNPSEMDAQTNSFPDAGSALIRRMVNNSLCIGNYRSGGGGGQKLLRGDGTGRTTGVMTGSSNTERFSDGQQQPPQFHQYHRASITKFAPLFEEDVVSVADASAVVGAVAPPLPPRMVGICGSGTFDLVIRNAGAHRTAHEEKQKFIDRCSPTAVPVNNNVVKMVTEEYERQQPPPSVTFNFTGDDSQATRLPPPPLRRDISAVEFSSECLTRNSAETSTTNVPSSASSDNHFLESSVSKATANLPCAIADASTPFANNNTAQKQHSVDTVSCSSTGGRGLAGEARRRLLATERNTSPTKLAASAHGDSSNVAAKAVVKKTTINRKESKSSLKRKVTKSQRKEKRATKTLGIVVGIFLICWVPFFSINIINAVCTTIQQPSCEIGFGPFFYSTWIGYMNSFMNPIIYTIFNTEFRRAFKSLILGKNAVKRQQRQARERRLV